jgi:hypothetical protein
MAPNLLVDQNGNDTRLYVSKGNKKLTSEELYETEFSNRIAESVKFKKIIVFVIDVPLLLSSEPESCIATRPLSVSQNMLTSCISNKQQNLFIQDQYRKIIARLKKSHPELLIYDSFQNLCDQKYCYGYKDGIVFYYDKDHLSIDRSKLILSNLINFLK